MATKLETFEQQEKDAKMIFNQISSRPIGTYEEAERMVVAIYVQDLTISRSGISRALEMLKHHYKQPRSQA